METHSIQYLFCAAVLGTLESSRELFWNRLAAYIQCGRHMRWLCCTRPGLSAGLPLCWRNPYSPVAFCPKPEEMSIRSAGCPSFVPLILAKGGFDKMFLLDS